MLSVPQKKKKKESKIFVPFVGYVIRMCELMWFANAVGSMDKSTFDILPTVGNVLIRQQKFSESARQGFFFQ